LPVSDVRIRWRDALTLGGGDWQSEPTGRGVEAMR
jgi:hypothetical protein